MKSPLSSIPLVLVAMFLIMFAHRAEAQGQTKWIQVGSLQNWYSEKGGEIEEGNVQEQQYGLRWPALVNRPDGQAAKGFWIGVTNFTDTQNKTWNPKVINVGPRVNGNNEFFPKTLDVYAPFDRPRVFVDGSLSLDEPDVITAISDTIKSDRLIVNKVTTALGITIERKIFAFSQQYHDNYHIMEYTFTNTGNSDIGLPARTLTGVMFYWQFRYAPGGPGPGWEVNNSARWGINAMNDARGYPPDIANPLIPSSENDIKCQFTWLGFHAFALKPPLGSSPNAATFDNIGAPIFSAPVFGYTTYFQSADTNWRLGAAQLIGNAPIYADKSGTEHSDDPTEPSTTNFLGSDEPITQSDVDTIVASQYTKMTEGHAPRHAWLVDPSGRFSEQTVMGNIGAGASGGWSEGMGYGPYTIAPGQSIRIAWAEGVSGLTFDECVRLGLKYKQGIITTKMKNDSVLSGRLRLFETLRRAVANYKSGFKIPQPPYPPSTFNVRSGGGQISLSWDPNPRESANGFVGYRIYRSPSQQIDSTFRLIYQCGGTKPSDPAVKYDATKTYSFNDVSASRGVLYYYCVTSLGSPIPADAATRTPAGALESSQFYTRTSTPATSVIVGIENSAAIPSKFSLGQNYPNPFNPSTTISYTVPTASFVSLKVFNVLGEQVGVLVNERMAAGSYHATWNASRVPSGIYYYRLQAGAFTETRKAVVIK